MAADQKFVAPALAAFAFLFAGCVSTERERPPAASHADVVGAPDIAAAARAHGLGGTAGLERWVAEEPARALIVARSTVALDIVSAARSTYARQSSLNDARFADAERERGSAAVPSAEKLCAALALCPAEGTSHYAFALGLELVRAHMRDGRAADAARAFDAAVARGLSTQDEQGLRSALADRSLDAKTSEALLHARLAELAFAHGSPDRALADARAAADTGDVLVHDRARLVEGRILLAQQQAEAARAVLEPLAGSSDDGIRRDALAVLGVIAGEHDDLARAEELLRRSLAGDGSWNGAARASADLAVVLVRLGREEEGRTQFAAARARFTAQSDPIGLARTLMNESAFERSIGAEDRSRALEASARKALNEGGVLAAP